MMKNNPRIHLDLHDSKIEVRRYPSLDDPQTYTTEHYTVGAVMSDTDGVFVLALERQTEDGHTEVLKIRFG